MRIVSQNVLNASVTIDGKLTASINKGYLLLVSFKDGDDEELAKKMAEKIVSSRLFPDSNGKTNLSLKDYGGEILSVPQFTLYASIKGARRPSFTPCLNPSEATKLFDYFNLCLTKLGVKLSKGVFGADMKVQLLNDGPFTMIFDSEELF